ncbi:MAG: hypothetical protein MK211_01115 [Flavobacteriales bacterium]|nr:hypothetical protein [Flavobacteriales bacterium]
MISSKGNKNYGCLIFIAIIFFGYQYCSEKEGKYCAYVYVYNPKTGTEGDYDLYVQVEEDKVIKLFWNNGGFLDSSHFNPDDALLYDNYTTFKDDRGREFSVKIQNEEHCN